MNGQEKILTALLQNAEMGCSSIKEIFPNVHDTTLKNEMRHQLSEYQRQTNTINRQMSIQHIKADGISPMTKAMSSMGIKMNLAKDNSSENIAKMLIKGTNTGIISINHALNNSKTASPKLVSQAKDLLDKEQHYIDRLKGYL